MSVALTLAFATQSRADETVTSCGFYPNTVFVPSSADGMATFETCPGGAITIDAESNYYSQGQGAVWQAVAPPGLLIVGAAVPPGGLSSVGVNAGSAGDFGGDFYWQGGSSDIVPNESSAWLGPMSSSYFGFLLVCGRSICSGAPGDISVTGIVLDAHETIGPSLSAPTGLWQAKGWVRGTWTLAFSGDSPSGLCSTSASLGGQRLPGSTSLRDPSTWHQCAAGSVSDSVVTQGFGQGAKTLQLSAQDAAGQSVGYSKTVYIDNQQPTVALSGPTDAPSTAGTQHVTATATAGPSGVDGISCSVDGATSQWYPGSSAQVPVGGVGEHRVLCFSENNAVAANGARSTSPTESFAMKIGVPTVTAIAFSKIVDQLRCERVRERVKARGRRRARTKTVTKCHPRTVLQRRTVSVKVRRHGRIARVKRIETVRVVVLPHVVDTTSRFVRHGQITAVSGSLGTDTGAALGGQAVEVLAAADDGQGIFQPVAGATTATNGGWSVTLPAGPSRLIEAEYGGGPNVEPSLSGQVTEIVPAKVELLNVSPRSVAWGHTVRITGRLQGGYLPPGGALVRLRIGLGSAFTTYGVHEHVGGNGQFTTSYTFGVGAPSIQRSYWFQIASLPMGDYPYAPASSRKLSVLVGGHPADRRRRARSR